MILPGSLSFLAVDSLDVHHRKEKGTSQALTRHLLNGHCMHTLRCTTSRMHQVTLPRPNDGGILALCTDQDLLPIDSVRLWVCKVRGAGPQRPTDCVSLAASSTPSLRF